MNKKIVFYVSIALFLSIFVLANCDDIDIWTEPDSVNNENACKRCSGTGKITCPECNGRTYVDCDDCSDGSCGECDRNNEVDCERCTGYFNEGKIDCPKCDGTGKK